MINGINGCGRFYEDSCFITAHDARTGRELWRTFTIARPGEPGGDTWGDLPFELRGGGDVWMTGSWDPELGLVYFRHGAGQALGRRQPGPEHGRSDPIHELDPCARPRDRAHRLALRARARRIAGHGRGLRARADRYRGPADRPLDRQARNPVEA